MIVCHCNVATDKDIRRCASKGEASFGDVTLHCRAGTSCGGCIPAIQALLQRMKRERPGAGNLPAKRSE